MNSENVYSKVKIKFYGLGFLSCSIICFVLFIGSKFNFRDYDCTDFALNTKAAQDFYLSHGGPRWDWYNLDSDRDGIACEVRPITL